MKLEIRPLHRLFGAEILGLALSRAEDAEADEVQRIVDRYGVAVVRDADLDDEGLARFAARFGPLQNLAGPSAATPAVIRVSNLADDGRMKAADDKARLQHDANRLWHVDSSFMAPGATYSFLHARIVPETGGDTEFFDARAAFEALDAARQAELRELNAEHSIAHSWRLVGVDLPLGPGAVARASRKLVRRHAPSGREALVIPSHVERVSGLDAEQSLALIGELTAIGAAPERVYRHAWRRRDLLVWDNRCVLHRATPYRAFEDPRDLRSCRVMDVEDDGLAAPEA